MRLAVLSLLCLLTACFTEPSADRVWKCSVDQPLCPEGQTCVNDWCVKDGTATPDLAMSSDMLPKAPCTDGFPIGTKGAWACRGKFSPTATKASGLCQNGFKLCTDGSLISDAECSSSSVKGFYFACTGAKYLCSQMCRHYTGARSGRNVVWLWCCSWINCYNWSHPISV